MRARKKEECEMNAPAPTSSTLSGSDPERARKEGEETRDLKRFVASMLMGMNPGLLRYQPSIMLSA